MSWAVNIINTTMLWQTPTESRPKSSDYGYWTANTKKQTKKTKTKIGLVNKSISTHWLKRRITTSDTCKNFLYEGCCLNVVVKNIEKPKIKLSMNSNTFLSVFKTNFELHIQVDDTVIVQSPLSATLENSVFAVSFI